jgi:hypothetical protein
MRRRVQLDRYLELADAEQRDGAGDSRLPLYEALNSASLVVQIVRDLCKEHGKIRGTNKHGKNGGANEL